MSAERKVAVQIEVAPVKADGAFDSLAKGAESAQSKLDAMNAKMRAMDKIDPGNPFGKWDSAIRGVTDRTKQFASELAKVSQQANTFERLAGGVGRFAGAMGSAIGTASQLARGVAQIAGAGGNLEQLIRMVSALDGIGQVAGSLGRMGSGLASAFQNPAGGGSSDLSRIATSAGAGAAGRIAANRIGAGAAGAAGGAAGAAGGAAATTATASLASRIGSGAASWGSRIAGFGSQAAGRANLVAGGAFSLYGMGRTIYDRAVGNTDRLDWAANLPDVLSWWGGDQTIANWLSGVRESNQQTSGLQRSSDFYRQLQRSTGQRRPEIEAAMGRDLAARRPVEDFRRQAETNMANQRFEIQARIDTMPAAQRDRRFGERLDQLAYLDQRGSSGDATAGERQAAENARRERLVNLQSDRGADPAAIAANEAATNARRRSENAVATQANAVTAMNARGDVTLAERTDAAQRLLQLQREHGQAVEREAATQSQLRQSEVDRLQNRQRLVALEATQARGRADSFRDETRQGVRSIAGMDEETQQRTLALTRRLRAGEQLDNESLQHLSGLGIARDAVNAQLDQRAANNPVVAELLQNLGRPQEQARRDAEQQRTEAISVQLQGQVDVRMSENLQAMQAAVNEQIAPAIERIGESLGQNLRIEVSRMLADSMTRAFQQMQANANANAGGGMPGM